MKIFIDSAIIEEIKDVAHLCEGCTTNPTLIAKSGKKFEEVVKEITKIIDGPISAEAVSLDAEGMLKEARALAKIHKNIVVKITMTDEGLKAIEQLSREGIKTNCTLVFSANQALLAAKAGATYVSPFVGRLDDIGQDGMQIVEEIVNIYKNYNFNTEVIVASVRNLDHVKKAAILGAHIATVPYKIIKKMMKHELTDKGIDKFLEDWKKVPK
jgi:transaldolase